MTMYRRFCCNDLLRLGTLNLNPYNPTDTMYDFLSHLGKWPENCHVAYSWGGRIIGYVFGCIEGTGYGCTGQVSMLCLSSLDLDIELVERLENSCDEIYHAYSMRKVIHPDDTYSITECEKMGYLSFTYHDDGLEVRKPLPRLESNYRAHERI